MTRRRIFCLLSLLSSLGLANCSEMSCTEAACADSLTIDLSEPIDVKQSVTLELDVEGTFESCEVSSFSTRCGAAELIMTDGKLAALLLSGSPSEVRVHAFRAEENVVDHTFSNIEYSSFYANGPECDDDACHSAQLDL